MVYAETIQPDELMQWLQLHCASAVLQREWRAQNERDEQAQTREKLRIPHSLAIQLPELAAGHFETVLRWLDDNDRHSILTFLCPEYPTALRAIHAPPLVLFLSGDSGILAHPSLGVVGSRHATPAGLAVAEELCRPLARAGVCLVSGMAMGIDAVAHRSALDVAGASIGVLGCGIDRIYPARNRPLYYQMREKGLLVSEYLPGTPPRIEQFPRRNRIITGLSQGLLVVEAGLHSGSLQSAQHAIDQNRNIYAVPGSLMNPMVQGCHRLIQQGAQLVTCAEDVLADYPAQGCLLQGNHGEVENFCENGGKFLETGLANPHLLANVDFETTSFEVLLERSELGVSEVVNQLISLELGGWIKQVPGGYVRVRR